ncbi:MAG: rhodanese-like domain-containing protein [Deltaproteobacteria bacterium]|nr:rhodanese-like domain-containing protein [Deltaproteobacteria bacterium]
MNRTKWVWTMTLSSVLFAVSSAPAAEPAPNLLEPSELRQMLQRGEDVVLIDTMSRLECMDRSIPGSLCIADEEFFAKAPKLFPDKGRHLLFYCESDRCYRSRETAVTALQQGYARVSVLRGGIPAWKEAGFDTISQERIPRVPTESIKPERLARWLLEKRDLLILDIRREERFREGHLPGAINIPLYRLHERYSEIPLNRPVLVVDDRGLRSFLASSYLVRKGVADVKRLFGGMERWQKHIAPKRWNP